MLETYFFVRTKPEFSIEETINASHAFRVIFEATYRRTLQICTFKDVKNIFRDGFIARSFFLKGDFDVSGIEDNLNDISTRWTIFQIDGDVIERPNGPLKEYLWVTKGRSITQFFLLANPRDRQFIGAAKDIQAKLKRSATDIAFEYMDGVVIISATDEPLSISANRCFRELDRFDDWIITGSTDDDEYVKDTDLTYWV